MGEMKINIGKMVDKMQLFKPESVKSATGEEIVNYVPSGFFLSEILELNNISERIDDALSGRIYLKFNARSFDITTDWKVEYNGIRYDIDKVNRFDRGLNAMYECSKMNME